MNRFEQRKQKFLQDSEVMEGYQEMAVAKKVLIHKWEEKEKRYPGYLRPATAIPHFQRF